MEPLVLIVGKTGNGKSSLANAFLSRRKFEVTSGIMSATLQTQFAECLRTHHNKEIKIQVTDFPDVTSDMTEEEVCKEVDRCKTLTFPYPSATCLVIRADVRFTPEEYASYRKTRRLLGDEMFGNMVVVFTFSDRLLPADRNNFSETLQQANKEMQLVLKDAGNRYVIINNKADEDEVPSNQLMPEAPTMIQLLDVVLSLESRRIRDCPAKTARVLLVGPGEGKRTSSEGHSVLHIHPDWARSLGISSANDRATAHFRGFELEILDTRAWTEQDCTDSKRLAQDVDQWMAQLGPGPEIVLYVVKDINEALADKVFNAIQDVIGEEFNKHVITVITKDPKLNRKNPLYQKHEANSNKMTSSKLPGITSEVKQRVLAFDNTASSETERALQRNRLLKEIEAMKTANHGRLLKIGGKKRRKSSDAGTKLDGRKVSDSSSKERMFLEERKGSHSSVSGRKASNSRSKERMFLEKKKRSHSSVSSKKGSYSIDSGRRGSNQAEQTAWYSQCHIL